MAAPEEIKQLVSRFADNLVDYKSGKYNETQVRREFIDPMFTALGWDVANKEGYAEAYKDVVHEARVKVGGLTKAPDYGFRIGGARKFFLEAKKPSVRIKEDEHPAYQLRRYAWSAKLPLSVLTDFEEFAVYDCRIKPGKGDSAGKARVLYFTFDQYEDHWDEIAAIFSKEAILKGSFDEYAEDNRSKRGTAEVDDAFLDEIERWRELLAKNIALRNNLSVRELNFSVQKTIDRIIFLRICEDRGIERYAQLQGIGNGSQVYSRLLESFDEADARYNSGLFHFKSERSKHDDPDHLTPRLNIDDKPLKDILKNLYYPDSPYEFSVLPADILGQVYEQFLGYVIELTPGGRAKVKQKPEVKKVGGVYYTPTYIVDYIVRRTVGELLEERRVVGVSPSDIPHLDRPLRVLDPACGSGSFLISAYQHLLDWYHDWYQKNNPKKWARKPRPPVYQTNDGGWALTLDERKRILLDHIYGVDIDSQAVEVTKLSLLLKVLEPQKLTQVEMYHQRVLPDLAENIKCGNSLIGSDFYDNPQIELLDQEIVHGVNVFDWEAEFPAVFERPTAKDSKTKSLNCGFEVVIGNPPYFNVDDTWGKNDPKQRYLKLAYTQIYNDKTDILFYFLARAVSLSLARVGLIVSRAFLEAYKADKLRGWLSETTNVSALVDFRDYYVFEGVGITTAITLFDSEHKNQSACVYRLVADRPKQEQMTNAVDDFESFDVSQDSFTEKPWVFGRAEDQALRNKIDARGEPIGDVLHIGQGMQTGRNSAFGNLTKAQIDAFDLPADAYFLRARNSDIQPYFIQDSGRYIIYPEDYHHFKDLPQTVREHLSSHRGKLEKRAAFQRGNCAWWQYTWPLHKQYIDRPKLYCPYLAKKNRFALDKNRVFLGLTDTTVLYDSEQPEDIRYILGLLNSRLLTYRFQSIGKLKSGGILEYFWNSVSKLPVRRLATMAKKAERSLYDNIVVKVEIMAQLQLRLAESAAPHGKKVLERQIAATDRQIDRLVYKLYDLKDEDIRIVEEVAK